MAKKVVLSDGAPVSFVLDTNVLLYDPNALFVFKEHEVVIPITVIEEIDRFKKDLNETGRNARTVSRKLDALREQGSLSSGVKLPDGGTIRVVLSGGTDDLPHGFGPRSNDNLILGTAKALTDGDHRVVLVTRDTNMRLKGDALGLATEDYKHAHLEIDESYTGVVEATVPSKLIDDLYSRGWVPNPEPKRWHPHQFVLLQAEDSPGQSAMVRYHPEQDRLAKVGKHREGCWGIFARNKEQLFALELLLDDRISLVTLDGMAGTGKTLLAIAAGLLKVTDENPLVCSDLNTCAGGKLGTQLQTRCVTQCYTRTGNHGYFATHARYLNLTPDWERNRTIRRNRNTVSRGVVGLITDTNKLTPIGKNKSVGSS